MGCNVAYQPAKLAIVVVLCSSGVASAEFVTSSIVVNHLVGNRNPVEVLNQTNPPATVTTLTEGNGVTATLHGPVLQVKSQSYVTPNPSPIGPSLIGLTNNGVIRFDADASFSLQGEFPLEVYSSHHYFYFVVQNTSTSQFWKYGSYLSPGSAQITGDLPSPAPAGSYEMTWTHTSQVLSSMSSRGTGIVTLTTVPEPASAALLLGALPMVRRQRRC